MRFSGFGTEEALYLSAYTAGQDLNLIGLLIAGIIIAGVGVLDDVAATQASAVFAFSKNNKEISKKELFSSAMSVGKDHISAVINTLVLAYVGASLPLILLFAAGDQPLGLVFSSEIIAEELVRILIPTMGLILAVPITTLIAVWLNEKFSK